MVAPACTTFLALLRAGDYFLVQHYSKKPGFQFNPINKINEIQKDQALHGTPDFATGHDFKPSNVHTHDHQYKYPGVESFLKARWATFELGGTFF